MSKEKNNLPDVVPENKPMKGRGGRGNFPNSRVGLIQSEEDKQLVKQLLNEVLTEYKQPKVTSDEELAERISNYFDRCAKSGQVPTVEEMCMSTGYSQSTFLDWEHGRNKGFSEETSRIIKKAKDFLKTFDAKLAVAGKLNFLTYCFRAKNYYGMVDKVEHTVVSSDSTVDYDAQAIKERYMDGSEPQTFETTATIVSDSSDS